MDRVAELLMDLADPYCFPVNQHVDKRLTTRYTLLPVWFLHISPVVDPKQDGEDFGRHHLAKEYKNLQSLKNAQPGSMISPRGL